MIRSNSRRRRHAHLARRTRGTTLVELAAVLAAAATLTALAGPTLTSLREQHRVEALAAQLETDLQLARSEAVMLGRAVRLTLPSPGCYVIHTGDAEDCACGDGAPACTGDGTTLLRSVVLPANGGVTLASNVQSLRIEPDRGTVTPTGTLRLRSERDAVNLIVNIMGRIRACSPDGSMPGLRRC